MTAGVSFEQSIQRWGNGLGVRITAPIAKAAQLERGVTVRVEVVEGGVFLRTVSQKKMTLAQKLKAFDPVVHGGEAMASGRLGVEVF